MFGGSVCVSHDNAGKRPRRSLDDRSLCNSMFGGGEDFQEVELHELREEGKQPWTQCFGMNAMDAERLGQRVEPVEVV